MVDETNCTFDSLSQFESSSSISQFLMLSNKKEVEHDCM